MSDRGWVLPADQTEHKIQRREDQTPPRSPQSRRRSWRISMRSPLQLLPAHCEPVNPDCRRGDAAAEFEIAADLGNIAEHLFQIAGYRDLFDRIGQFAVSDPHAGGSTRVVACDQVCAVAENLGYVEAAFDVRNDLLRRLCARFEEVISRPDARCPGKAARCIGGGLEA